ncbi:hypothetical protein [Paenibacillus sp. MMO-58]|uniref:hypothetical protein n=1 Tax=Paenibacillus sp. MMO-58 TaxID=3081290 RepID=UPI0030171205
MAMILIILIVAFYLTLLNFKRLRKLSKGLRWLLYALMLFLLCDGIYSSARHFNPDNAVNSLIPSLCMAVLIEGARYVFRKRRDYEKNWSVDDYPIEYSEQNSNAAAIRWKAGIKGWSWMSGHGNDREDAYLDLVKTFDAYKKEGNTLPRPGTTVLGAASQTRMDELEEEAVSFFYKIFGWDYYDLFISDKSTFKELCSSEESMYRKLRRVEDEFGVKVPDDKILIVDILELIREKKEA